jgi:hypothetical protein
MLIDLLLASTDVGLVAIPAPLVAETQHSSWSRHLTAVRSETATSRGA